MQTIDWLVVAAYFSLLIIIVYKSSRRQDTSADYFLAGREIGWFVVGTSLFASNIGSEHIVGLAGNGATSGMAMAHWELHAWVMILLAYVFVPFYYKSGVYTIPEFLERRFDARSRWLLSLVSLVAYIFTKVSVTVYAGALVFQVLMPDTFGSPEAAFWVGAFAALELARDAGQVGQREFAVHGRRKDAAPGIEHLQRLGAGGTLRGEKTLHENLEAGYPAFSPDGRTVYFLASQEGSSQLYAIPAAGGEPRRLTDMPVDVGGFQVSPDGSRVAFNAQAFIDCGSDLACTKARLDERAESPETGVLYDRMFVRHWDTWNDGRLNRVFVADLPAADGMVSSATAIATDVVADVPSRPFGDSGEYTWTPDGQALVFSARESNASEPWSTNFDIYRAAADGASPSTTSTVLPRPTRPMRWLCRAATTSAAPMTKAMSARPSSIGPSEAQNSGFTSNEVNTVAKPPTMRKPMMPKLNRPP